MNLKLGRMHSDRHATRARREVVTSQGPLVFVGEPAARVQRQRMRGDDLTGKEVLP